MRKISIAAAAAAALVSTAAIASVTFDSTSGTGWSGKGDVQYTYGWNNAALQKNANGVAFSYLEITFYDVTCEWDTETQGKQKTTIHHDVTLHKKTSVSSAVDSDPRQMKGQKQFTGYYLTGFGATETTGGTLPSIGSSCPQAHSTAVVTDVVASDDNVPGALYVTFSGDTRLLVSPPVITTTL